MSFGKHICLGVFEVFRTNPNVGDTHFFPTSAKKKHTHKKYSSRKQKKENLLR